MATATDSGSTGEQFAKQHVEYLERRIADAMMVSLAGVMVAGGYATRAAGEATLGWVMLTAGVGFVFLEKAYRKNGRCNRIYNATLGRVRGEIDETTEGIRGDLGWQ